MLWNCLHRALALMTFTVEEPLSNQLLTSSWSCDLQILWRPETSGSPREGETDVESDCRNQTTNARFGVGAAQPIRNLCYGSRCCGRGHCRLHCLSLLVVNRHRPLRTSYRIIFQVHWLWLNGVRLYNICCNKLILRQLELERWQWDSVEHSSDRFILIFVFRNWTTVILSFKCHYYIWFAVAFTGFLFAVQSFPAKLLCVVRIDRSAPHECHIRPSTGCFICLLPYLKDGG